MRTIVAMLALAIAALAGPAYAVATWEHFNADPAYQSREAAIADAPRVLRQVGYPEPVIALLTEAMKNPGVETHVTNGMKLDFMRSGSELWRNVLVKFKKPPHESEKNMDFSAPSEEWMVELNGTKWTAGIPKVCNNLYGKRAVSPPPLQAPSRNQKNLDPPRPLVGGCPNVYHLKVYVYPWEAMLLPGVAQTAAKEEMEGRFVHGRRDPQHVSRTHYTQLQKALADGTLDYSSTPHVIRVSLIMTPEAMGGAPTILNEEVLGEIVVKDYYSEVPLSLVQIKKWDAIRLVPVRDEDIASPPRYSKVGFRELRFFFRLPNTKLGEWDSNPDPDCTMGVLFIERKK